MTIKTACDFNGIKINDRRKVSMGGTTKRSKSRVTHIARHHSGVNVDQSMSILEGFWKNTHKWSTGGYHVVIHFDGSVDWNYDYDVISNGVGNHNSYIFNISVLGNGKFTAAQEKSWMVVCKEAQRELGIPTSKVLGHKEFKGHESNSCPGINMNTVRAALANNQPVITPVAKPAAKPKPKPVAAKPQPTGNAFVKAIQKTVGVKEDGWDGPNTRKGVIKLFQRGVGTPDDGIVGNNTLNKAPVIRLGSQGWHVYALQAMLYLKGYKRVGKPDKIAGTNTIEALAQYQKDNGLVVDREAWKAVYSRIFK